MNFNLKPVLVAVLVLFALGTQAQKLKVTSGKLKDVAGNKSFNMVYTYDDNLKLGKKSEADYVAENIEKKNKKEAGTGDAWAAKWQENKEGGKFFDKFEELFNDVLSGNGVTASRDNADATCTITLNVYYLDPGYNVGVQRKPAYLSTTATFTVDGKEVAVVDMSMAPGQDAMGYDFDSSYRIAEAFAKTGKTLGKTVAKEAF
ncbi:hypothetical protein N6H18_06870 [Reichenbachiella agarivorans]|uniref:DUF4468 domain-containing protein n=1 Tax=Reichenbachiella agarivorans TaxID=2979464 RepID=A0ABY6CUU4_9BACT|nr:hypothetical protein [Reichenbachiella agarivorans]UXP33674.1 hypothetical protein N6H18_06870 [Reichenbachiella agarivorans]